MALKAIDAKSGNRLNGRFAEIVVENHDEYTDEVNEESDQESVASSGIGRRVRFLDKQSISISKSYLSDYTVKVVGEGLSIPVPHTYKSSTTNILPRQSIFNHGLKNDGSSRSLDLKRDKIDERTNLSHASNLE
jgi:hypothetical protein